MVPGSTKRWWRKPRSGSPTFAPRPKRRKACRLSSKNARPHGWNLLRGRSPPGSAQQNPAASSGTTRSRLSAPAVGSDMTDSDVTRSGFAQPVKPGAAGHLSALYAAALLLAALLLFWIQPLYTRMALPFFGGAPAVWTTASMFFQFALLAGYLYAHFMSQMLNFRWQVSLHLALLALVFLVLPVTIGEEAGSAAVQEPVTALLRLLALGLGLPFFAIAATAPLL